MKKQTTLLNTKKKQTLIVGLAAFLLFILWTAAVRFIDVSSIGPNGSSVGFAAFNGWFHRVTGVHMLLYVITDWLGLVPIAFILGFAVLGLVQWIGRKSLVKVDKSLLALGVFYLLVMGLYLFFESYVINYRPVLIDGFLEASYPSSTTLLVMSVIPTAIWQLNGRIRRPRIRKAIFILLTIFMVFMVTARLVSGVHWATDIVGGAVLSLALVAFYVSAA